MFGNYFFKIFILLLFLSLQNTSFARISWEKKIVQKIVGPQHIQLVNGEVMQIIGVQSPDKLNKDDSHYCHARKIAHFFKIFLENEMVKILVPKQKKSSIPLVHIKKDSQDVAELLLEKGFVRFAPHSVSDRYDRKYQRAESRAKKEKRGIWKGCDPQSLPFLRQWNRASRTQRKKFTPYLANISGGKVRRVISGNTFALGNGLKIKLLGVQVPSPTNSSLPHACFGKIAKKYLQHLILGKKVYLKKDVSQFDDKRRLLRYVFTDVKLKDFINQKIILDGYGKFKFDERNQWYLRELSQAQKKIEEKYKGAWEMCKGLILSYKKGK
jgi:endonuclease YncB( thermonuclease family)